MSEIAGLITSCCDFWACSKIKIFDRF